MSDNGCTANFPENKCVKCGRDVGNNVFTVCDDCWDDKGNKYDHLGDLAKQAVIRVMQEGEAKYPANDFMDRRLQDHASHAKTHLDTAWKDIVYVTRGGLTSEELKNELEHTLARVVIMLAKMGEGKFENSIGRN
jgi:hypothetical protein